MLLQLIWNAMQRLLNEENWKILTLDVSWWNIQPHANAMSWFWLPVCKLWIIATLSNSWVYYYNKCPLQDEDEQSSAFLSQIQKFNPNILRLFYFIATTMPICGLSSTLLVWELDGVGFWSKRSACAMHRGTQWPLLIGLFTWTYF